MVAVQHTLFGLKPSRTSGIRWILFVLRRADCIEGTRLRRALQGGGAAGKSDGERETGPLRWLFPFPVYMSTLLHPYKIYAYIPLKARKK
jgi:hypothetical protein